SVGATSPGRGSQLSDQAQHADVADLARFGYKQELRRVLGVYSSFAVAFSYISPSTGIFTLFILGIGLAGPSFFWSWPIVVIGQLIIGLNFAEVSSHFPVAGSVYQWTKYLSNRTYAWFTGWIYLFAGVLTVAAVVATVPLLLIPLINNVLGSSIPTDLDTERNVAALVLLSTTLLSIFGVRIVAFVNNTGVVFEILGMVVFALILVLFYHHQSLSTFTDFSYLGSGFTNQAGPFLAAIYVCCLAIQTSTIRLAFGMGRDGKLPLARYFNNVNSTLHTPIGTCIVVGVLAGLPLIYYAGAGTIAIGATGMIYLSYILGNTAILLARLRGWPKEDAPFKLGQWGLIVNILGLVWGVAMEINFLWPRNASVGGQNPPLSALPNITIGSPLGDIPVFEFTLGLILLVGVIYWAIAQRKAPDTTVAPAGARAEGRA